MLNAVLGMPLGDLLTFVLAGLVLNLTPGADVIFAVSCGAAGGARAGAAAGLGVGLGGLWHVAWAAVGVAALIVAHPSALWALQILGAGYLLWLGWGFWRAVPMSACSTARRVPTPLWALWQGFAINALNPKVAVFILAFLPQFTDAARGPVGAQIMGLGAIFALSGAVVTAGYGMVAARFGAGLELAPSLRFWLRRGVALVFVVLALRLLWA